jgi:hypothetical protein
VATRTVVGAAREAKEPSVQISFRRKPSRDDSGTRETSSRVTRLLLTGALTLGPALVLLPGCRGQQDEAAPAGDAATAPAAQDPASGNSASATAAEPPLGELPEGTAEELFAYLAQLEKTALGPGEAEGATPEAAEDQGLKLRSLMRMRVALSDKILSKEVPEETKLRALRVKLDALRTLAALDKPRYRDRFTELVTQLAQGGNSLVARMARCTQWQSAVTDFLSLDPATTSPEALTTAGDTLVQKLDGLLADPEAGPETLDATRNAMGWIFEAGNADLAAEGYRKIGEKFQSAADANVATEGRSLLSQAMRLELTQLSRQVLEKREGALAGMLQGLDALLQPEQLDPNVLGYAIQTAEFLEFMGYPTESLQAYEKILSRFSKTSDASVVATIQRTVDLARRRLGLIGSEVMLEGVTLGGDAFDWSSFRGKWVLVGFWTTWQVNAREEIDRLREAVRARNADNLEVVLVNLDDDRNTLERFLKEHPIGWKVLVQADGSAAGFENPNAVRCGVETVPFIMLVNPAGNVADIHLMGDRLKSALDAIQ